QNAPNPCATCRAGRGRKYYEEKKAFHCARCDHSNCQPNPEKVRQNEQLEKEVEYQREK
ncbi:6318_t:CDS:2, partial [Funneliformis geosporum]